MSQPIGFVGLGVMGAPMAGHLLAAGHPLVVWNRTQAKSQPLADRGAQVADSLEDLGSRCQAVFLCVSRTEDVLDCLNALVVGAAPGTLFVDHSTIAPSGARQAHGMLAERGHRFVDAPITGGSMGAQNGTLTIFCGGGARDVAEAIEWMKPYTKTARHVGGPGSGQLTKLANQIAVAGALVGLCESLAFAQKAGLDLATTRELLAGGAAGSWAFENYGPRILNQDWSPGFSIANQRKDFGYCAETAVEVDAAIPATLLVDRLLAKLDEKGQGGLATTALFEVLTELGSEDVDRS